jgi:sec-independent protein translocase protein TatB
MFDIGWGDFLVLIVAGLFILGPERLPGAATWLGRTIRQVREYATGAQQQMQAELGTNFDDLRKPLQELRGPIEELRGLRGFDPKRAVNDYLRDATGPGPAAPAGMATTTVPTGQAGHLPLADGEDTPYDVDAT